MKSDRLPIGWERTKLSNLISESGFFADGDWVESKDQDPSGEIRLVQLADIGDGKFLDKSSRFINFEAFERLRCSEIFANDILVARMPDPLGRCCIFPELPYRCVTVVDVAIIRPESPSVNHRWLCHFVNAPQTRQKIAALSSGTTRRRISRKNLSNIDFPVPPLSEQKQIADKLDVLLARVDACRERLERVPNILKRFRQSVLSAAISGALTEDWRRRSKLANNWQNCKLIDVIVSKPRNGYSPKPVDYATSVKTLTLSATTTGKFIGEHFKYVDEIIPIDSHLWLTENDILIQRANTLAYVGVAALYTGPTKAFIYPDLMMKIKASDKVISKYLYYALSSEEVRNYFRRNATGTSGNMPKINQSVVSNTPLWIPSLKEQEEIVARVENLFSYEEFVSKKVESCIQLLSSISNSILSKAFRGELIDVESTTDVETGKIPTSV